MAGGERWIKRSLAHAARRHLTPAEERLWTLVLRANRLGYHFRSQHPIRGFIVDFCCLSVRVIVEVDGGVHASLRERDAQRTAVFEGLGFVVLRFSNDQIRYDLWNVRDAIRRICDERRSQFTPTP